MAVPVMTVLGGVVITNYRYILPLLVSFAFLSSSSAGDQRDSNVYIEDFLKHQGPQQSLVWPYFEPNGPYYPDVIGIDGDGRPPEHLQLDADDAADVEEESNFLELEQSIGQPSGIAINNDQNLVVFHRSNRQWDRWSFGSDNRLNKSLGAIPNPTLTFIDFDKGKVLSEHGANMFYMPHGLTIDADGNLWVTDVGTHQVHKLDGKTMKPVLTLGEKLVPGSDEKHFCKPTDVAVAKNGDFFVADGYCNSRIMKFDKNGKFLTSFGRPNSQEPPMIGEFSVPHSLVLVEDLNLLCVADRENRRIQCFAAGLQDEGNQRHPRAFVPTGTFFTKAENIGRVYALREKRHFLVGVTNHDDQESAESQIFAMDMNTGRASTFAKNLENLHALALSDEGDIYVSQIEPNQIVKFSVQNPDEI